MENFNLQLLIKMSSIKNSKNGPRHQREYYFEELKKKKSFKSVENVLSYRVTRRDIFFTQTIVFL